MSQRRRPRGWDIAEVDANAASSGEIRGGAMPVYAIVIVNAVLAVLVVGAVAGVQLWSILTQHRDAECEGVRLRRPRLRISIGFDKPRSVPSSRLAREDTTRIPDEILLG